MTDTDTVIDIGRGIRMAQEQLCDLAGVRKRWDPRQHELADMAADTPGLLEPIWRKIRVAWSAVADAGDPRRPRPDDQSDGRARPAQTIPGARLETMPGMGHDLPRGTWPALVNLIDDHIRTASVRSADGQEP